MGSNPIQPTFFIRKLFKRVVVSEKNKMADIVGVYGRDNAAGRVLQLAKRREQAANNRGTVVKVVYSDGKALHEIVRDLDSIRTLERVPYEGDPSVAAVAHVGPFNTRDTPHSFLEPIVMNTNGSRTALAMQGVIRNYEELMAELERGSAVFAVEPRGMEPRQVNVIHHLVQRASGTLDERVFAALERVQGGLSLIGMNPQAMVVAQKSLVAPLLMGRRNGGFYFASEVSALKAVGVTEVEEIPEKDLLYLHSTDIKKLEYPALSTLTKRVPANHRCSFDSLHDPASLALHLGMTYGRFRQRMGERLVQIAPVKGEAVVVPIPDSGMDLAIGYARASGLPLQLALRRSHQAFRSHEDDRFFHRINVVEDLVAPKVVLVDDRLYGGATICRMNALLRRLEDPRVEEVHVRVGDDPAIHSCPYGVSSMSEGDLLMRELDLTSFDEKRICEALSSKGSVASRYRIKGTFSGPDSFKSLPLNDRRALSDRTGEDCTYCFTGSFPSFDTYGARGSEDPQLDLFSKRT